MEIKISVENNDALSPRTFEIFHVFHVHFKRADDQSILDLLELSVGSEAVILPRIFRSKTHVHLKKPIISVSRGRLSARIRFEINRPLVLICRDLTSS